MDLTNIQTIKSILKQHRLWASKKLGQHFLISKKVLEKIIETADLKKDDVVLEIGPGIGTLTQALLKKISPKGRSPSGRKKVIAIEKDSKMADILRKTTKGFNNLEIINEDILKSQISNLKSQNYKIVANIPYYITSPLLKNFLENKNKPKEIILMVQKEVAERICAKPGKMSILAIAVQFYAKPEIISLVPKENFWPKPKVDSAIIKIIAEPKTKNQKHKNVNEKEFFRLVRIGFSSPRKKLENNLSAGFHISKEKTQKILKEAKIEPSSRAQELSLNNWRRLYITIDKLLDS